MDAKHQAFTLIELLVVITIIVVLLAMLVPALDKAMEAAERVKCGANLHAWGVAIPQHYLDHRRKLLEAPNHAGPTVGGLFDGQVLPNHPRFRQYSGEEGQFSLDAIAPYIQGGGGVAGGRASYVGEAWYCPSSIDSFFYKGWQDEVARTEKGEGDLGGGVVVNFMFNDYSYFAHGGSAFRSHATQPQQLVGSQPEPGKVLMADTIYRWAVENGAWWFNHSEVGYSMHANWNNEMVWKNAPPPITGTSQLFGDGSVAWKGGEKFNPNAMHQLAKTEGWISSAPNSNPGGNINFY